MGYWRARCGAKKNECGNTNRGGGNVFRIRVRIYRAKTAVDMKSHGKGNITWLPCVGDHVLEPVPGARALDLRQGIQMDF